MRIAIIGDVHISERAPRARKDNFLETTLNKLDHIAEENDKVIILGDTLNSHSNSTYLFNILFRFFSKRRGQFIVIPGNHDICGRNHNDLDKTTIGSLYYTDSIELKMEPFTLGGINFAVSLVDKSNYNKIPVDVENKGILLGHNYWEMNACPEESLTREDLKRLNYKFCLLGHDHQPYDDEFIENTILLRPGSLTRTDTQLYNEDRVIRYFRYDTELDEMETIEIPTLDQQEVYIENAFMKKNYKSDIDFIKIADVLKKFQKNVEGSISLDRALREIETPKKHIDFIKMLYESVGMYYS